MSLPPQQIDWQRLDRDVTGLRLGLMLDAGVGLPVEPEVKEAVTAAARAFEAAGARVEPMAPILDRAILDGIDQFWRMRFWADFSAMPAERRNRILPYIRQWVEGAATLSGVQTYRGFSRLLELSAATNAACSGFDFVLSPTAPVPAFPAELASPINDPSLPFEHIGFTLPFNMSEQPAASINCGYTKEGLPIGLQIVGRRFDDPGVLQMARAYERLRPPQLPWPEL
jgi:aspartyl-tRNA(Asn)/glutamyl-tRNA(Gln) amidotransferase subunit A